MDECRLFSEQQFALTQEKELKALKTMNVKDMEQEDWEVQWDEAFDRSFKAGEKIIYTALNDVESEVVDDEDQIFGKDLVGDILSQTRLDNIWHERGKKGFMKHYFPMNASFSMKRPSKAHTMSFSGMGSWNSLGFCDIFHIWKEKGV